MSKPIKALLFLLAAGLLLALYLAFGIVRIPKELASYERMSVTLFQYRGVFLNPSIEQTTILRAEDPEKFQAVLDMISRPTYRAYWDQNNVSARGHEGDAAMYQIFIGNWQESFLYTAYDDGAIDVNGTIVRYGPPFSKGDSGMFDSIGQILAD
ncbi:MAG: hypothetical protein VB051_03815 [Candidatus Pelethousia sp.]|nr:hypothetical protein [Candidatus Pelethousia sp.]